MKMFYEWAEGIDVYATLQTLWGLDETPAQQHLRNLLFAIIDESIGRRPTYGSVAENLPLVLLDSQQSLADNNLFKLFDQLTSLKAAIEQVDAKVDTTQQAIEETTRKVVDEERLSYIVGGCVDNGTSNLQDALSKLASDISGKTAKILTAITEASNALASGTQATAESSARDVATKIAQAVADLTEKVETLRISIGNAIESNVGDAVTEVTSVVAQETSNVTEKIDSYSSVTTNYLNDSKRALTAVLDIVAAYKSTLSGLESLVVSEMKEWAANAKRIATEGADVEITLAGITEAVENLKQTLNTLGDLEGVVKQAYGVVGTYANFQKYIDQRFADINARQTLSDVINSATTLLSRPSKIPAKPVSAKF